MKYLELRKERASGELTIIGTRIRIAQVINMLANGFTVEQIHTEWFPHVSIDALHGAIEEATSFYKHNVLLDENLPPRQYLPISSYIAQYFWGDDLSQLDLEQNQKYIVETLLEKGDAKALHWLFSNLEKQTIVAYLPTLKLSKKSEHFWSIYLA